jgi:hypothetical protein
VISHRPEDMGALGAEQFLDRLDGALDDVHRSRLPCAADRARLGRAVTRLTDLGAGRKMP